MTSSDQRRGATPSAPTVHRFPLTLMWPPRAPGPGGDRNAGLGGSTEDDGLHRGRFMLLAGPGLRAAHTGAGTGRLVSAGRAKPHTGQWKPISVGGRLESSLLDHGP